MTEFHMQEDAANSGVNYKHTPLQAYQFLISLQDTLIQVKTGIANFVCNHN